MVVHSNNTVSVCLGRGFVLEIWPETGFRRVVSYTWGHQELARNDNAGRAIRSEGSLGSGPVVPGPRGAGHLLRSAGLAAGPRLFRDADFAEFYCPDNGRDSVPPSLLATALLLQSHDKVSDAEARPGLTLTSGGKWPWGLKWKTDPSPRARYRCSAPADPARQGAGGLRVQPAAGPGVGLPEKAEHEGGAGHDQHPGSGRGEADTFNLLADGIVQCCGLAASGEVQRQRTWGKARGYEGYLGFQRRRAEAAIDWSDKGDTQSLLAGL